MTLGLVRWALYIVCSNNDPRLIYLDLNSCDSVPDVYSSIWASWGPNTTMHIWTLLSLGVFFLFSLNIYFCLQAYVTVILHTATLSNTSFLYLYMYFPFKFSDFSRDFNPLGPFEVCFILYFVSAKTGSSRRRLVYLVFVICGFSTVYMVANLNNSMKIVYSPYSQGKLRTP